MLVGWVWEQHSFKETRWVNLRWLPLHPGRLTRRENIYSATELECLAVVWAHENMLPCLESTHSIVFTDHQALVWMLRTRILKGDSDGHCVFKKLTMTYTTAQEYNMSFQTVKVIHLVRSIGSNEYAWVRCASTVHEKGSQLQ